MEYSGGKNETVWWEGLAARFHQDVPSNTPRMTKKAGMITYKC